MFYRIKQKFGAVLLAAGVMTFGFINSAMAVPPAYVTDALTSAQTTLEEYVTAAAPKVLASVAIVAALGLIIRLVKRALSGG